MAVEETLLNPQKKPKKSLMEMVVSKSKKDITFSTVGFLLRKNWIMGFLEP